MMLYFQTYVHRLAKNWGNVNISSESGAPLFLLKERDLLIYGVFNLSKAGEAFQKLSVDFTVTSSSHLCPFWKQTSNTLIKLQAKVPLWLNLA